MNRPNLRLRRSGPARERRRGGWRRITSTSLGIATVALALLGCGSSKPSYCAKTTDLQKAVQQLQSVSSLSGATNSLTSTLTNIDSSAQAVVSAAKSDFPGETSAISSSVAALRSTISQLSNPQSKSSAVSQLPAEIVAAIAAVNNFQTATKSKCS